jgi:hypothetical protein
LHRFQTFALSKPDPVSGLRRKGSLSRRIL